MTNELLPIEVEQALTPVFYMKNKPSPLGFYELIERSNLVENSYVADVWNIPDSLVESLQDLGRVLEWPKDAHVAVSTNEMDGELDDFVVNNALMPIVTMRLRKMIEAMVTPNLEWLPINVYNSEGCSTECFVINSINTIVYAINREKSDIDSTYPSNYPIRELRKKIQTAWKVALRSEKVEGYDLFRVSDYPFEIFCSRRFKNQFLQNGFTGVSFSKVDLV